MLDTHTLLWWYLEPEQLRGDVRKLIGDDEQSIFVSAVSAFEIALKQRTGKLPAATALVSTFSERAGREGFDLLSLSVAHGLRAGMLPLTHKDPFDRLLAAQALVEDLTIVSIDHQLDQFGVRRLW